jgi:hypothetical protein
MSWQIALTVASTAMSASQSMSQAKNQQAMYKLQAMQTEAESARKALQYEQRANETLRKVTAANAANVSRRYAGGVLGLEGSAKLIETMNMREAGRDFMMDIDNASNALMTGSAQSDIFGTAGDIAGRSGRLDALSKLAGGAFEVSKTYKTSATPKAAPSAGSTEYWKGAA